jgi:MEMO1 family protein
MAHVELKGSRPSAIAGAWYPGSGPALRRAIESYLAQTSPPEADDAPIGLIVPHAGYMYSGQVAAYAYRQIVGHTYDSVVIVSPIHRGIIVRGAAITAVGDYRTPLGPIPLNQDLVDRLDDATSVTLLTRDDEHSLEIQLPFLQVTLGHFDMLPVMMGDQSFSCCQQLGQALADVIRESGRHVLLVASTDLSHFYPYEEACRLDHVALGHIAAYDPAGLARALEEGETHACGGGPVLTVLIAGKLLGATSARILNYANSGDVTGDRSGVVGYAAGVIT